MKLQSQSESNFSLSLSLSLSKKKKKYIRQTLSSRICRFYRYRTTNETDNETRSQYVQLARLVIS